LYDPVPDWSRYLPAHLARDSEIRDMALIIVGHPEFAERFNRYFLGLVIDPEQAVRQYWPALRHFQRQQFPRLKEDKERETAVATAVMIYATHRLFQKRGAQYGFTYDVSDNLRQTLLPCWPI
jgi:hypothetical protein